MAQCLTMPEAIQTIQCPAVVIAKEGQHLQRFCRLTGRSDAPKGCPLNRNLKVARVKDCENITLRDRNAILANPEWLQREADAIKRHLLG